MKWLSHFSISKPVTTIMLIVSMVGLGFIAMLGLPVELMPNINYPAVTVEVTYEGVSPEDMEDLVTDKIEDSIQGIEGIDRMMSYSNEGSAFIIILFEWGEDLDIKSNDVKDKITKIRKKLPDGIDEPEVTKLDIMNSDVVMDLNISGDNLVELRRVAEDILKPKLERISGVATIDIYGGLEKEILVKVDPYKLESYALDVNSIIKILSEASVNTPAGNIKEGDKEFLLRVMGKVESVKDIENIVIYNQGGKTLYLKDVVDIYLGVDDRDSYYRFNGEEAVSIQITKSSDGNTVIISNEINKQLEELRSILPDGIELNVGDDSAEHINESMDMVKQNAIYGLILAAIVLFFFLKNIRATLIVAAAIPTSIIFTFVLINQKGISMNLLSLGGLALGVGMLVDNSVVVLENIFRHITEYKKPAVEAARDGASEMSLPILASTATTIAVFLPIVFTQGLAGEIFRDFSYTVAFSLAASMIIALTFVPMISSKLLKPGDTVSKDGFIFKKVKQVYHNMLIWALKRRGLTISITAISFVVVMALGVIFVGQEFFPKSDDGIYQIKATLPNGLDIEKANRIAIELEKIVKKSKFTEKYISTIQKKEVSINVEVPDKEKRKESIDDIMNNIRSKVSSISDATIRVMPSGRGPGGGGDAIQVQLQGEDYQRLIIISEMVKEAISKVDGLVDLKSSFEGGNPEFKIKVDREKAEYYGLSVSYVSSILSSKLLGIVPLSLQLGGEEVDVKVELKDEYKNSLKKLENIMLRTPKGNSVRLREIASLQLDEGPAQIMKEDNQKTITISGNSSGRDLGGITSELKEILNKIDFPRGYKYSFGGDQRDMQEMFMSLGMAFLVAIFLVYMILASQFESFILPLIIMVSVPLALAGVYVGLLLTGFSVSITVMIGIIMLAGIVVNNAIVLIDYINLLKAREIERHEAIKIAGETRLRPIFMTTATTVFGMIPLALGFGASADFYQPLAITVIFGLSISTLLTLIVIPVLYSLIDDMRIWFVRLFKREKA